MHRSKYKLGKRRVRSTGSTLVSVYRRRLSSLKTKAYELSTLCDIPALIIAFDSDGKVDTFPENKEDVNAILNKYNLLNSKVPEKRKQNSLSVLQAQILKKQFELIQLKLENEKAVKSLLDNEAINHLDSLLVEVQKKIMLKKNQNMQMTSDLNNLQLITTEEESVPCDNALCGDITCHKLDDLSVEDYLNYFPLENYLHEGDDFSVKDLHGRENLSSESDLLGGTEQFSVKQSHGGENLHVLFGGEKSAFEDVLDCQVEGSAQSNDGLSDEIACLLDECNTWYYYP